MNVLKTEKNQMGNRRRRRRENGGRHERGENEELQGVPDTAKRDELVTARKK